MSERKPNPYIAPKITRPGESVKKTGSRRVTDLLPDILQTTVNKQFFDSTFEQLMSTGNLEPIRNFVGETIGDSKFTPSIEDDYLLQNKPSDAFQFAPAMINKNQDNSIDQVLAYDDLINSLRYNELNVNNHSKLFNEKGYTLDIPINYDMFINHHRYFWVLDVLPPNELKYTSFFDIDTIIGETTYTTPTMLNGRSITLENGMRIRFCPHTVDRFTQTVPGNTVFTSTEPNAVKFLVYVNNTKKTINTDFTVTNGVVTLSTAPALTDEIEIHAYYQTSSSGNNENDAVYIVDGVGEPEGIVFTKQFEPGQYQGKQGKRIWNNVTVYNNQEPSGFDADEFAFDKRPFDLREHRMTTKDYTVEQRHGPDRSAWSRSNLWVHEQTIENSLIYQGTSDNIYAIERYRAVRPIIEYKKGIEKYRNGTFFKLNVDHYLESKDDPATSIVGKTSYSVIMSGISDEWTAGTGYERGQRVKVTMGTSPNFVVTFWECVEAHGESYNPTHGSNHRYWEQIVPVELEDNDLIIFFGSSNATYNNKIWEVGGVGSGITLTERYNFDGSNGAIQLNDGEKILLLNGFNTFDSGQSQTIGGYGAGEREAPKSGAELYVDSTTNSGWRYARQKEHRSQGMPVVLYDTDLIAIDTESKYSNSDFAGATLFDFVHNQNNDYDIALGFNPEYVDYGNNPGLNFHCEILDKRFTFVKQSSDSSRSNQSEIKGYYYYKNFTNNRYFNMWSEIRNAQPVNKKIRKVVSDTANPLVIDVGHSSFVGDRCFNVFKEFGLLGISSQPTTDITVGKVNRIGGKLPTLFLHNNNTYTFNTMFTQAEIEFVNTNGSPVGAGITRTAGSGNQFDLQIGTPTVSSIKYRLAADPANFGTIFFSDNPNETNVKVYKNGDTFTNYSHTGNLISITSGLIKDDVYEFHFMTHEKYSPTGEGQFDVADVQKFNPQNINFDKVSYGDLINHLTEQMTSNPLFNGQVHGTNNYRNIVQLHESGGTIRQQPYSTELLNQLLVDVSTNPFSSLQFTSANYEQFKEKFKSKIVQLNESLDETLPVYHLVDKTLEALNLGKNKSSVFGNSQMAMYRDYKSVDVSWVQNQTPTFNLPEEVNNYDDTFNHIQVWIQIPDANGYHSWIALTKFKDYTLTGNKITITKGGANSFPSSGKNFAHIRWYPRTSVSFVPPSAVKLGLMEQFVPEIRSDYSQNSTGTATDNVIIGHDGSVHVRNGTELFQRQQVGFDPVDAGLWDLENRIYNNLSSDLTLTVNQNAYMPNAHRPAVYTWSQVNETIRSEFNKYKANNNITELNSNTYYDATDKFTWNYSSVGPQIGGWRGLYHFYFNTDRPHTHPWEMLGHNLKPTWWDANYSWTDAVKRQALLLALQYGQTSDPALGASNQTYDINYSYKNYDWNNQTLVTLLGALNDPETAGVVPTPTEPAKDFVFGDWGPVEAEWRRSSQGKIAMILAFLRTRPLIVLNNYFRTARRQIKNLAGYDHPQEIDIDELKLISWKDIDISGSSITGKIIESVRVLSGGSGYTSAPDVSVNDNFGTGGAIQTYIENGEVVGASVHKQGQKYFNRPLLEIATGGALLDPILAEDATHYYNGLSNAIINFGVGYGMDADTLKTRLNNLSYQAIVKAGGFVNRNNKFILESSQDKGRVFVPEENVTTVLYTSKPDKEYFYGGIKIDKTANGYTINGFDNSLAYFKYNKPNTATDGITTSFSGVTNVSVLRYKVFEEETSTLDYNTELNSIQEVFDFINGYGYYLNELGFTQQWRTSAGNFVTWAVGESTTTLIIIPDDSKVVVNDGTDGYFDNIDKKYDGVYNISNRSGNQISSNELIIDRKSMEPDSETTFQVKDDTTSEIFGIRLYKVQLQHIFVFDNITNFDDVLHDLSIGQSHTRIVWQGSRTRNWNGKLYSPGYIVNDNTVLPNYDTTAKEVDQYLGRTNTLSNSQLSDVARFNAGYNKPSWGTKLDIDDDSLYEFVKGSYKYKGTDHALSAFMRNQSLFDGEASAELLEQWAIRIADFGDTSSRSTLEFQITPELLVTSPQPVRITKGEKFDVLSDIVIDIDNKSPLKVSDSTEDNFQTRPVNTFKDSSDELFAGDFTTSGLPLLTETDYRVINKEDFTKFPEEIRIAYDHSGDWQNIGQWNANVSYKFNEKVLYQGKTWTMLDEDGSSGIATSDDPITVTGANQLPVIPSSGQTLSIDGNTITLIKTANSSTRNTIKVSGTQDIKNSNVVPHGSTLILGESSGITTTITFTNSVASTVYNDITKLGTVTNPSITGSNTATLIIDGTTVNFNDTNATTTNITAQTAYENAFNSSWIQNQSSIATTAATRIQRIEGLRTDYIAANSAAAWGTWITTYYTNNAGLNIAHLVNLVQAGGATQQAAQFLLDQDLIAINNIRATNYIGTNVANGSQVVAPADISASQNALNTGAYTADIATYLKSAAGQATAFTGNTVVKVASGTQFKTYDLNAIVQEINDASISNVTASASGNRLKLTKTTNTPANPFSLSISVGSENTNVGFSTATETIQASANTTVTTPNLTQTQVIQQINNSGISGISAQAGDNNSNVLQINSTKANLFIGAGTSNASTGLPSGLIPATTTTNQTNIGLNITDIVEQINTANISGVSAVNANNKVRITSTNSTLVIGSGTANSTIGFTAQTYNATQSTTSAIFNAILDANGNPVFIEDQNDPNIFSIWVADDSEFGNYNLGYQVYQSMDFGMYTYDICGGIESADEAEIKVSRQPGDVQAHNLIVGDYILIRGSNSVPNIDGIHKVVRVSPDRPDKFYIDEFIEINGNTGNIYPLRKVRFSSYIEMESDRQQKINNVYKYNFSGIRQNLTGRPIFTFVDDDGTGVSAVYKWDGSFSDANGNIGSWVKVRDGNVQARNDLLEHIKLYDAEKQSTITQLETYDPAKGIIFGFVDREIDFKTTNDIANYNFNNLDGGLTNIEAWGREYLGTRWWNTSTAVYLDYEQSSIDYQQNNWGRLFDGASIDIYEWTASPVLPEEWINLVTQKTIVDGKQASGEAFSITINGQIVYNWTQEDYYNTASKQTETVYYFWVKNKINSVRNSNYNVFQLSQILLNPTGFNVSWAAQAGSDSLLLTNIANYVNADTVAQVNQKSVGLALPMQDWLMLAEKDPNVTIPEYLHIKVRDSLAGFNRFSVDKTFTTWNNTTFYDKDAVVKDGANYYINLVDNQINNPPSTDTDMSHWRRIYDYSFIEGTQIDDIRIWRGQPVPDLKLHKFNRYGHQIRPRQSLYRNLKEARQNFVYTVNSLLSEVNVIDEINNWENAFTSTFVEGTVTYRIKDYVNLVDWHLIEKDNNGNVTYRFNPNTVADVVYTTKQDYIDAGEPAEGSYVLIKSSSPGADIDRAEMYYFINGEDKLVYKEKATVQLSEEMWNQAKFGNGFDAIGFDVNPFDACSDNTIARLMDLLRTEIFVGTHHVKYNQLWFKLLFSAILQNTADDFAFKTTYTHLGVKRPLLINKPKYQNYSIDTVEEFVNDIKPFHTKLLSSMESNTHGDATDIEIEDIERNNVITMKYEDHSTRDWACDLELFGGGFTTVVGNIDESTFTTQQADITDDYNGNVFVQPVCEGWGEELVPTDFTENISIAVQTMLTPTLDSGHTRSFRMMQFQPMDIQSSNVIVDAQCTTLFTDINATDTTIVVANATGLDNPNTLSAVPGVIYIGCERIEYQAIDNNTLLFCTRGTMGTSAKAHTSGDRVINTGPTTNIPTVDKFSHYGDGLRLAYNDSGMSLTEHVAVPQTPEHRFIRNAGKGTI